MWTLVASHLAVDHDSWQERRVGKFWRCLLNNTACKSIVTLDTLNGFQGHSTIFHDFGLTNRCNDKDTTWRAQERIVQSSLGDNGSVD